MKSTRLRFVATVFLLCCIHTASAQLKGKWIVAAGGNFQSAKNGIPGVSSYTTENLVKVQVRPGWFAGAKWAFGPVLAWRFTKSRTEGTTGGSYFAFTNKQLNPGGWVSFFQPIGKSKFYYSPSFSMTSGKYKTTSTEGSAAIPVRAQFITEGKSIEGELQVLDFSYRLSNRLLLQAGLFPLRFESFKGTRKESTGVETRQESSSFGLELPGSIYEVRVALLF